MTSAEIRQSFLDFFKSKQHIIVPSAPLLPTAPNLLFTNAGMNQFVPYFLGDQKAPWKRVADTQKCIRAGGKHNDLEDVGYDTYHHTLFEMLGNWSFGDYFKQDSLTWGWELLTQVWGIPPKRLFATVYAPDKAKGDPADFDQEAYDIWARIFTAAGLDPKVHIVNGNKKDNFWMMGDTGPCGPCSEIHFNLLPSDDETAGRQLVNSSNPRCIEIWNHVFIQFNANADGSFAPLAAKHVDTGMGFERVAGIYATSKGFKDFTEEPSNYNADIFKPAFDKLAALSGKTYTGTVPTSHVGLSEQQQTDVAFRVLADHARCVSCAIADGILPGNEGRNYVIRRILRRGVLYGKKLGLKIGDFAALVAPVVESLGSVFPELNAQRVMIERAIRAEEESFGRTLDKGLEKFEAGLATSLVKQAADQGLGSQYSLSFVASNGTHYPMAFDASKPVKIRVFNLGEINSTTYSSLGLSPVFPGALAFELYDTYGFPLDMTQLLAAERDLAVNVVEFESFMNQQRERGRAARKTDVLVGATEGATTAEATKFAGYELTPTSVTHAKVVDVVTTPKDTFLVFDQTPFYAEMGGQVGDTGHAIVGGAKVDIIDCIKDKSGRHLHKVAPNSHLPSTISESAAILAVDYHRRRAISRHHSATHLLQWALRKVLGTHVRQSGTHKTPERLRFDFSHFEAVTAAQLLEVEQLVNAKVIDNARVVSTDIEYANKPEDVLAFFGDKYGKYVRVVDIGGYSRELCGGTHVTTTGEIGVIKIAAEMAIAAGTRRIEAVAGQPALDFIVHREAALAAVSAHLSAGPVDVAKKLESLLAHQKELEKQLKGFQQKESAAVAKKLAENPIELEGQKFVRVFVPQISSMDSLKDLSSTLLHSGIDVVHLFARTSNETISNVSSCSDTAIAHGWKANELVSAASKIMGGKGGGKPDFAMGGGKDSSKLDEALRIVPIK